MLSSADAHTEPSSCSNMSKKHFKIGMLFLFLVLLAGPLLQGIDCFNDAHNLDHDAVLHTVDALLCIAITVVTLGSLLLWLVRTLGVFLDRPQQLRVWVQSRRALANPCPTFGRPFLALRV